MSDPDDTQRKTELLETLFGSEQTPPKVYFLMLLGLFLAFFIQPFADDVWWGLLLVRGVYLGIILGSLFAMTQRPVMLALGLALSLPALLIRDIVQEPSVTALVVADGAMVLVFAYVIVVLLRALLRHPVITFATVAGAISVYLLFGVMFSLIFYVIETVQPCSFNGIPCVEGAVAGTAPDPDSLTSLFYFSFVTVSTLGYGDITPANEVARTFASMEAVIGQLYLVVLLPPSSASRPPRRSNGSRRDSKPRSHRGGRRPRRRRRKPRRRPRNRPRRIGKTTPILAATRSHRTSRI